ncbi:response regulator transcription factor [Paenibacillus sp. GD4]|uniref:response regulator transcription factor n=1 Tax=Paenibacillus sp. GD4 TaxID=3068890 RepID=UPI0027967D8B|nr:response regulator transcription factor [Paenibacillus sp. GD4]MDQ1912911.1 response regulator transcription factor [Paenibacillus sp. GD4]
MIEILLVDDHPAVMEGTRMLLEQEGDIRVTLAGGGPEAIEMAAKRRFDLILVDMQMPDINGIDLAKQIISRDTEAVILIYTGFDCKNHFNLMMEAGIHGFVSKTANKEQLVTAVRCALRGETVLPTSLVKQLRKVAAHPEEAKETDNLPISTQEYKILKGIANGYSNRKISENLHMSQRSLEYSLTALFQKFNVKSRIQVVMKAKEMGLLSESDFVQ